MNTTPVRPPAARTFLTLLVVLAFAACGGSSSPAAPGNGNGNGNGNGPGNGPGNGNGNGNGPIATASVSVEDAFFEPIAIVVSPGETVTWTWNGNEGHNVVWDSSPGLTNSATQTSGTHAVQMPGAAGVHGYHCTIHGSPGSGMHGTVHVE